MVEVVSIVSPKNNKKAKNNNNQAVFFCNVLYENVPMSQTLSMGCQKPNEDEHRFSLEAWKQYLLVKLSEGASCIKAKCPHETCTCVVSPRVWRLVFTINKDDKNDADAITRYERHLSSNFVDVNKFIKWCPSAACGYAVHSNGVKEVGLLLLLKILTTKQGYLWSLSTTILFSLCA